MMVRIEMYVDLAPTFSPWSNEDVLVKTKHFQIITLCIHNFVMFLWGFPSLTF